MRFQRAARAATFIDLSFNLTFNPPFNPPFNPSAAWTRLRFQGGSMSAAILWPALLTVLSLLLYTIFLGVVGRARGKFNVPAPATSGNPDFERRLRVQLNTLEQLVSYLPSLWIFCLLVSPVWGAALGGLWIVGRILYAIGYYQAAQKRSLGFALTQVASSALLIGSLVGIGMQFAKSM
jgi:uncharacterized membrane protein YecN with MAPEG domain